VNRPHGPAALGWTVVAAMTAAVVFGPIVAGDGPPPDAARGALVAPGSVVWSATDIRGRHWTSTSFQRTGEAVILADGSVTVPTAELMDLSRHRVWLGTDRFGRDVLRLMLTGGRLTLLIAALGTLVAGVLGAIVGLLAGGVGGWIDVVLMRVVDALLAFPMMLFLVLAAAVLQPGPTTLLVLLGATSWMGLARLVRGQILALRERPYILAARLSGTPWHRMWRWHYAPDIRGPVSQDLAIRLGELILAESTLSYLGLGMPASLPTWGSLVADGLRAMLDAWWLVVIPGLAIVATVVALALIGEGFSATRRGKTAV
jgi:peptide/nickel transport system permease protein